MASPQTENGYTKISNEITEALWKINLSPYESRILWYLFRKTYGWREKVIKITLSQFSKDIGIDLRHVYRTMKSLEKKQMLIISKFDKNNINYGFQKNYSKWEGMPVQASTPLEALKPTPLEALKNEKTPYNYINKTKETSQLSEKELLAGTLSDFFLKEFLAKNPHSRLHSKSKAETEKLLSGWAADFRLLVEKDKQPEELIRRVIVATTGDCFWGDKVLSGKKLREKWDTLVRLVPFSQCPNVRTEKTVLEKIQESERNET